MARRRVPFFSGMGSPIASFCVLGPSTVCMGSRRPLYFLVQCKWISFPSFQTHWSVCSQGASRPLNCYSHYSLLARSILVSGAAGDVDRLSPSPPPAFTPADVEQRPLPPDVSIRVTPLSRLENIRLRHSGEGIPSNIVEFMFKGLRPNTLACYVQCFQLSVLGSVRFLVSTVLKFPSAKGE